MSKKSKKLGIIVPYRNRPEQLELFKKRITKYLNRHSIPFELIIVNQDDAKLFNRGMLLNIGFKYAEELDCDYVVFHDIDMIPLHVDYSYSDFPVHLATGFKENKDEKPRDIFDEYFGGVTLFPMKDFKKINGYSNKYWGWGYEDDDLRLRCIKKKIDLDELVIKNVGIDGQKLKFNGVDAYVECPNLINTNQILTIFVSFFPDELTCNHEKETDDYTIFSIPGYDFSISYNSFSRYNVCFFDKDKQALYVNSNIKPNYQTNICVTIDPTERIINVYQDGEYIGSPDTFGKLHPYAKEKHFYIGAANPKREEKQSFFKGYFDKFVVFNDILTEEEIYRISNHHNEGIMKDFGKNNNMVLYYNSKFIDGYRLADLTGSQHYGMITNCEIVDLELNKSRKVKVPHRRESTFISLPHEENGFYQNKWRHQATRWNQLRFYNEVSKNDELLENDGLSDLDYVLYGKIVENNITHINVGI